MIIHSSRRLVIRRRLVIGSEKQVEQGRSKASPALALHQAAGVHIQLRARKIKPL